MVDFPSASTLRMQCLIKGQPIMPWQRPGQICPGHVASYEPTNRLKRDWTVGSTSSPNRLTTLKRESLYLHIGPQFYLHEGVFFTFRGLIWIRWSLTDPRCLPFVSTSCLFILLQSSFPTTTQPPPSPSFSLSSPLTTFAHRSLP